ncbi:MULTISPECIES: hypothetical protein [Pseudanabaena]|uniref:hypothetical protein n=1 Tax=Pseudanabaena TaxID=1152 RepID=UPI00247A44D0|nr:MULTISPECIES: hypothetical protein [Pseudanabaena]MEA5487929.1 hypothetical protein [Pseudanabaena sp. CCNP1317]WGS73808.1 hypothetical protein OA858_07200 [Pseudanabaena galeata CCNP1313]
MNAIRKANPKLTATSLESALAGLNNRKVGLRGLTGLLYFNVSSTKAENGKNR